MQDVENMFLSTEKKSYDGMNDIPYTTIAAEVHKRKKRIHGIIKRITSVLLM